jgi:hypothetical protein
MRRRSILIALPVVASGALILGGPAGGRWSPGSATGAGNALVGTAALVAISTGTTTSVLYPTGAAGGDVALRLTNPNAASVRISRLVLDTSRGTGGFAVDSGHAACTPPSLVYATQTNGGLGWTVPAFGSLDVHLANAVTLATSAPSACQGASFSVYLTS